MEVLLALLCIDLLGCYHLHDCTCGSEWYHRWYTLQNFLIHRHIDHQSCHIHPFRIIRFRLDKESQWVKGGRRFDWTCIQRECTKTSSQESLGCNNWLCNYPSLHFGLQLCSLHHTWQLSVSHWQDWMGSIPMDIHKHTFLLRLDIPRHVYLLAKVIEENHLNEV